MLTTTQPATTQDLLALVRRSGILSPDALSKHLAAHPPLPDDPVKAAGALVQRGTLTRFQGRLLLAGRSRGFRLGSHVIKDQLGKGGMGTVFLAEHDTLKRLVAIKVLGATQGANTELTVERFLREARAAAALDHPNIVRIHDVAQQGEIRYLVMEYVDGQTLDGPLTRGEPIPVSRAVGYIAQAAAGLQHAHEKGFVHRDIKPANLILGKDGTVKILDMGLARSATATNDRLTERLDAGAILGTVDFISPEQAFGGADVDIRADIYSLGATFCALVTGRPPFEGNTAQKLAQHQCREAPNLAELDKTFPTALAGVVAKMLAKKPEQRYQAPAEVIAALAPWLSADGGTKVMAGLSRTDLAKTGALQGTISAVVASKTKRVKALPGPGKVNTSRRKGLRIGIAVGALVVAAVVALVVGGSSGPSPVERQVATAPAAPTEPTAPVPSPSPPPTPPTDAANPSPAPPVSGPTGAPAASLPAAAYQINFASLSPDTEMVRGRTMFGNQLGEQRLPAGWSINHFSKTADADYLIADVSGARSLGLRSVGEGWAQVAFQGGSLWDKVGVGATVTFQVSYQYEGIGAGSVCPQLFSGNYRKFDGTSLAPTDGMWRTVELSFTRPDNSPYGLIIHTGYPSGGTVWVRSVEARIQPATTTPVGVVYALDLSGQKPFRAVGKARGRMATPASPLDVEFIPETTEGDGALPAGWTFAPWDKQAEFLVASHAGSLALGARHTRLGKASGMMLSPDLALPTGRATVRFEYLTDGAVAGSFKFRQSNPTLRRAWFIGQNRDGNLPATLGKWVTVEKEIDLQGATGGYFEFHNTDPDPANGLWLRAFEVRAAGVMIRPAGTATGAGPPSMAQEVARAVASFDASTLPEGRFTVGNGPQMGESFFPKEFAAFCWKQESIAEFRSTEVSGSRAFGVTNLNDTLSSQIVYPLEQVDSPRLTAGRDYRVRVEYLAPNEVSGKLSARERTEGFRSVSAVELPRTEDSWRTAELVFRRPTGAAVELMFENGAVGEGNTLWVRKIEVHELK